MRRAEPIRELTERKRARDVSELRAQRADAAWRFETAPGMDWVPTDVQSFYTIYCRDVLAAGRL